jgi:hypothetical protein
MLQRMQGGASVNVFDQGLPMLVSGRPIAHSRESRKRAGVVTNVAKPAGDQPVHAGGCRFRIRTGGRWHASVLIRPSAIAFTSQPVARPYAVGAAAVVPIYDTNRGLIPRRLHWHAHRGGLARSRADWMGSSPPNFCRARTWPSGIARHSRERLPGEGYSRAAGSLRHRRAAAARADAAC